MADTDLPRWIVRLLEAVLPSPSAQAVMGDLLEERARRSVIAGPARTRRWIAREALLIVLAYVLGRLAARLSLPALVRDFASPRGAWRDVVHAVRGLRRRPRFAGLVAGTLGAGLAMVAIAVGVADALLLRPISPVRPHELRRIVIDRNGRESLHVSNVEYELLVDATADVATLGAASLQPALVRIGGGSFQTLAEVVSGRYFVALGAAPVDGRLLLESDDRPGAAAVAIVSEMLWRRMGSPASVLGDTIHVNGAPYVVVGIAPTAGTSSFFGASVDVWLTRASADPLMKPDWRTRHTQQAFVVLARLSDTSAQPALDTALHRAAGELARRFPDPWRDRTLRTGPPTSLVGTAPRAMGEALAALLVALAVLALTIVCANVGGLFFVRGAVGGRAAAIRLSLGAARGVVLRQAIAESLLLGFVGSIFALAIYAAVRQMLTNVAILPTVSLRLVLPLDVRLVLTTLAAGLIGGAALGAAPAWWLAAVHVSHALRDQSGALTSNRSIARVRRTLVAAQVAVVLMLSLLTVLFASSLDSITRADIGIDSARLIALDFDTAPAAGTTTTPPERLAREAVARIRALPGVAGAAMATTLPVDISIPSMEVAAPGGENLQLPDVTFHQVTPGYFDAVGLPIVRGRAFDPADVGRDVIVINQTLAEQMWKATDPIDRSIRLETDGRLVRVVGVARDSRYRTISELPGPHLYLPTSERFGLSLLVRSTGDPRSLLPVVQQALDTVGPGIQGFFPRTHWDHLAFALLPLRAAARGAAIVGVAAALLCALGLYGLVAWLIEMRRAEIGVRMALGATRNEVVRMIVWQGVRAAAPGLAAGLLLAAGAARLARRTIQGIGAEDPIAYVTALGALVLLVTCASWLAARRAVTIDPSESLRRG